MSRCWWRRLKPCGRSPRLAIPSLHSHQRWWPAGARAPRVSSWSPRWWSAGERRPLWCVSTAGDTCVEFTDNFTDEPLFNTNTTFYHIADVEVAFTSGFSVATYNLDTKDEGNSMDHSYTGSTTGDFAAIDSNVFSDEYHSASSGQLSIFDMAPFGEVPTMQLLISPGDLLDVSLPTCHLPYPALAVVRAAAVSPILAAPPGLAPPAVQAPPQAKKTKVKAKPLLKVFAQGLHCEDSCGGYFEFFNPRTSLICQVCGSIAFSVGFCERCRGMACEICITAANKEAG